MSAQANFAVARYTLRAVLLISILLAVAARGYWAYGHLDSLEADPDGYRRLAAGVLETGTLGEGARPTAFRPPLYPLLLAAVLPKDGDGALRIAMLHVLLGVTTVATVVWFAVRMGMGWWSLLAGALVAMDPILVHQSARVMTETLAVALVGCAMLAFDFAARGAAPKRSNADDKNGARPAGQLRWAAATGMLLGLAVLCRPTFWPWLIAVCVYLPMTISERRFDGRCFVAIVLAAGIVVSPWIARNARVFGRPVIATTHGGFTLLLANNDDYYDHLSREGWRTAWDSAEFNRRHHELFAHTTAADELADNRAAYDEAWSVIGRRRAEFLYSSFVRTLRFWDVVPLGDDDSYTAGRGRLRYVVGLWYVVTYVLAACGLAVLWRAGERRLLVVTLVLAVSMTAIHAAYWSDMRMRAPLVPAIALWAAAGCAACGQNGMRRNTL